MPLPELRTGGRAEDRGGLWLAAPSSKPRGSLDKNRKHVLCILWFAQNILGSEIFRVVKTQHYFRERKKKNLFSRVGVGNSPLQKSLGLNAGVFWEEKGAFSILSGNHL